MNVIVSIFSQQIDWNEDWSFNPTVTFRPCSYW